MEICDAIKTVKDLTFNTMGLQAYQIEAISILLSLAQSVVERLDVNKLYTVVSNHGISGVIGMQIAKGIQIYFLEGKTGPENKCQE